ncbi:MAG: DUF7533 family protein [Natrialbaceae archaeon]
MRLGIVDMLGLAATLIFALPVANFGITKLLEGETVMGLALVGVAVAMVAIPHYFTDPRTILGKLLGGLLPRRLREKAAAADGDAEGGEEPRNPE